MNNINHDWPPIYTLRHSKRARQVILQISPKKGLIVIVPMRHQNPKIEELLQEKKLWIKKNLAHFKSDPEQSSKLFEPPSILHFHAIDKIVQFEYQKTEHKFLKIIPINKTNATLSISHYLIIGPIEKSALLVKTLKHFLKKMAQQYLAPWLERLSLSINLPYHSVSIRSQSTLWGSCTAAKKISLNMKLLFLPEALTRYVLLHELCHTQYLNHSKRYWNLLKRFDPECLKHRKMLRSASQYLPSFIEDES